LVRYTTDSRPKFDKVEDHGIAGIALLFAIRKAIGDFHHADNGIRVQWLPELIELFGSMSP
jgi:hypothetical protein